MKKWVISFNLKGYDILQKFLEYGYVSYETMEDIQAGDEVFIYGEKPLNAIFLKCDVLKVIEKKLDEDYIESYNSKYVNLKVVENYLSIIDEMNYNNLVKNGLESLNIDGKVSEQLDKYLQSKIQSNIY